ncbi:cupin domain-containing protein [Paraburkholderia sp.]|jgi:cupin 2 domain-containing protein|uniref:cupin domain-containing protein n=1 Tax=Paraburkholderia sp. TaxID=1926495 RepID=UPI002F3EAFB0
MPRVGTLFSEGSAARGVDERVDTLVEQGGMTLERIVSTGQASPPDFWYDSPRDEWVVLLSGAARLEFEGEAPALAMQPGDYVLIEAHCRHRVAWTHDSVPSVWLALHYPPA